MLQARQSVDVVALAMVEYRPAAHSVQADEALTEANLPGRQLTQAVEPVKLLYMPSGQDTQPEAELGAPVTVP